MMTVFKKLALGAFFVGTTLSLSAQDGDVDRFSYSYGSLIGKSFDMQGISWEDLNKEDFLRGLEDAMKKKELLIDESAAQMEVQNKMSELQNKQAEVRKEEEKAFFAENGKKKNIITTESGLQYEVLVEGDGPKPTRQNKVTCHYHGTLLNGDVFDSSVERGQPATFPVTGVIQGWQEVLPMMPKGSKWRVYIPFDLAYGARAAGKIPGYSTLIFEIELIDFN